MFRFAARLALLFGLRRPPVETAAMYVVHRGEIELCAGTAFLGTPSTPIAKLSPDEALRCFGVRSGTRHDRRL